ncbi:MAG: hypothetical protein A3G08_02615 [Candidatus Magasanikbacteria bacterium RIFCSPLOWO2_12_FULL_47_9b]|nr:MAG: hypothetical protein A3I74_01510 [Candidatus Magasanikbacteria bacterium RIFCSPLOWO2_02_FULL_47_16]OGH79837.1 MAG: hypothetical protein A3C10_00015 [Candidatus Magasanikbacteria bacterium RIFCSPHIGHO2_02_FULL_48_18]OGH82431.1 MAG: hypothetical protein A3G08_02615 [Candidatus Magasanikbacteria bacterium RIFCSPLOWO2_12_FULL_47_9b]
MNYNIQSPQQKSTWPAHTDILFLGVLAFGVAIRLSFLLHRGTFWFDEFFSVHFAALPWNEFIRYAILETNPPLFAFLLRAYLSLAPSMTELWVRLPSLFLNVGSMGLLYWYGVTFFSKRTAQYSTIFFALSGIQLFLATEARAYSLLLFLTLFSMALFTQEFLSGKHSRRTRIGFGIVQFLLLFSHLTAILIPLIQWMCLRTTQNAKQNTRRWLATHAVILPLWILWTGISFFTKPKSSVLQSWYLDSLNDTSHTFFDLLLSAFMNMPITPTIATLFVAASIGMGILGWRCIKKQTEKKSLFLFIALSALLPPFIASFFGVGTTKYISIAIPALYLLVGAIFDDQIPRAKTALSFVMIGALLGPAATTLASQKIFSWRDYTQYIEIHETPHSVTLIDPFQETLPFNAYYTGTQPVVGVYLRDDTLSLEERIVRYNWNTHPVANTELKSWINAAIPSDADTIFLIQYGEEHSRIHDILFENGWAIRAIVPSHGIINISLFEWYASNRETTAEAGKKTQSY